ncbi:hypothetical protein BpHYR1_032112 [Brachionus plicatilis]|uniref:Uncharacterized protein n=1 Tax=Brachionus plicatilis TaxID=10195 RepID=A0A3M7RC34_BRAPC|nr:hypothetical protein BpHYR1_032112 [Brachionus plicatilis]
MKIRNFCTQKIYQSFHYINSKGYNEDFSSKSFMNRRFEYKQTKLNLRLFTSASNSKKPKLTQLNYRTFKKAMHHTNFYIKFLIN